MKILIAPNILYAKESAAYYLTRSLLDIFKESGDTVAVSADKANGFRNASLYPCTPLKAPLFNFNADNRSYEEYLYSIGASSRKYLEADTASLIETIRHFKPDWVLAIDRTAAMIAARAEGVRCGVFVNSAMYRNAYFPSKCLRSVNEILSGMQYEQVFDMKTLLNKCDVRFLFSPASVPLIPALVRPVGSRQATLSSSTGPSHCDSSPASFAQAERSSSALSKPYESFFITGRNDILGLYTPKHRQFHGLRPAYKL